MSGFDETDMWLLRELAEDGSVSIPILAKKMGVSSSVLYSRIKRMRERGLIVRFTVEVDEGMLGMGVRATVGINRDPKAKASLHKAILAIPEVVDMAEVTGRFDMLVTLRAPSLEALHDTVTGKIGHIAGVQDTETFVELQKRSRNPSYGMAAAPRRARSAR
ncbi:MAG: Lrp/AsnC family transcriptional regulator [Thaumarchaeota archaeon]|nr:Lrp/AsnC family transcriptional regulator [Nitrososphaerota archaeon]MDD9809159.1 Lrp/AsnC family transcriptional regulator [Nitrososphaerota archaeon]MDD9842550.1 Lrp/AsnC family transcriptional regulator [Nitrososphaerota archaeon]RNJ72074.1 MAG: Lrp/AsnC family transcriptional regulator [Thaumarchaeota archaeon S14]